MGSPLYEQTQFRGRNDNGSQTTATWKAAANTNWTQNADEKFRVRLGIGNTNNTAGTCSWRLQARRYSGSWGDWFDVTSVSSILKAVTSTNYSDNDDTTQQVTSGAFTADNDGMDSGGGLTGSKSVAKATSVEVEYCVQIVSGDVSAGNLIELRAELNDTTAITWTQVPSITVAIVEAHSGSAAVSGVGTTAYTATKTGKVAATSVGIGTTAYTASGARAVTVTVPSVGATAYTGKKTGQSTATIAGIGATAATGEAGSAPEEHSGTAAVAGVGASAYTAAKTGKVAAQAAGIGATAYTGAKGAKVAGLASGVGATAYTGAKGAKSAAAVTGIGATAYTAGGQRIVAVTLSGIGTVVALGGGETPEEHSGSAAVTGIGATGYTGRKGGKGAATATGIGATGYTARGGSAVAVALPGIGIVSVTGGSSTAEEHSGTAAVVGIGTIAVTYRHPIVFIEQDSQVGSTTEYAGQSNGTQGATVGKATAVAHAGLSRSRITKTVKITG